MLLCKYLDMNLRYYLCPKNMYSHILHLQARSSLFYQICRKNHNCWKHIRFYVFYKFSMLYEQQHRLYNIGLIKNTAKISFKLYWKPCYDFNDIYMYASHILSQVFTIDLKYISLMMVKYSRSIKNRWF